MDIPKNTGDYSDTPFFGSEFADSVVRLLDLKKVQMEKSFDYDENGELYREWNIDGDDFNTAVATLTLHGIDVPTKISIHQSLEQFPAMYDDVDMRTSEVYLALTFDYGSFEIQYSVSRSEYGDTGKISKHVESNEHSDDARAIASAMRMNEMNHYRQQNPMATPEDFIRDMIFSNMFDEPSDSEQQAIIAMLQSLVEVN